ncbi:EamA family transporter [Microlunatus endophyticus]|uniref:EamA family transporter n=1 Tax=Microlunatus endophyticus TaxID=1716077 RepID=UPI0016633E4A|nr:EamA family transporter [Microlunatus endophyticus]
MTVPVAIHALGAARIRIPTRICHAGSLRGRGVGLTGSPLGLDAARVSAGSAVRARSPRQPPADAEFGCAVAWIALLSGLGGYGAFLLVLRRQGAAAVGTWLYLSPPATMIWTWLMFGDRIGWLELLGLMITAAGVALAISRAARRRR